jgi:hypothetical protein
MFINEESFKAGHCFGNFSDHSLTNSIVASIRWV